MSVGQGRGKRRRLETEDTSGSPSSASSVSSVSCLAQQAVAMGVVNIDEVDLEGRFVRLKNSSDKVSMALGEWDGYSVPGGRRPKACLGCRTSLWGTGGSKDRFWRVRTSPISSHPSMSCGLARRSR